MATPQYDRDADVRSIGTSLALSVLRFAVNYVKDAYEACEAALTKRRDDADKLTRERYGMGPDDDFRPSVYVEGHGWSPDLQQSVIDLEEQMDGALSHVRVAFMVALYHTFERQVLFVTRRKDYDQAKALSDLRDRGISIDGDRLNVLRVAVHASKHGPASKRMAELRQLQPDLIEHDEVVISAKQMQAFFDIFIDMRAAAVP